MHIKVDEDLPIAAVQMLKDQGHDAAGTMEQGMGGWKDPALWQAVQDEDRYLITADKGFADARIYPPGTYAGVLLLRPHEDGICPIIQLLQHILASYDLEALAQAITVATHRGIRIRRASG